MSDINQSLNKDQEQAVKYNDGPLLLIAGAGTGKTRVISNKIAYIISKKLAKPSEILALTFTEKAASEMEERVDLLVPYGFVDTKIATFHSFGNDIIKDFSMEMGLPANYKVLNKTEQAIFLRQHIYNIDLDILRPVSNPIVYVEDLLTHFSRLKDELISPEQYLKYANKLYKKDKSEENKKTLELATAYQAYQDLMIQSGNLDYGDQIFLSYELLKKNKSILDKYNKQYKYILIDEFQDTNYAQYELIKLITDRDHKITVVGDDDQSIYKFRGASISNILSFKNDYKECKQIVLNENYRSTKQILEGSYKLISHNNPDRLEIKNNINKKLNAQRSGKEVEFIFSHDLSTETEMVSKKIKEIKKENGYNYKDFAILARANNHLTPFIQSLNYNAIPNIFIGPTNLFSKNEIRNLLSFLRLLVNPNDSISFFQLAASEIYKINHKEISKLYAQSRRRNRSVEELGEQNQSVKSLIEDLEKYRKDLSSRSAGEILYDYLKEKKYINQLLKLESVESEIKIKNIASFFEKIFEFDNASESPNVLSFLENIDLITAIGDDIENQGIDPDIDAVNMLTMHSSKGLEFKVVFIINAVNDRIPSRRRSDKFPVPEDLIKERLPEGDFHIQEERRLFYVAATRAMDRLFITGASDYGGKRKKKPSRFVFEILDDPNLIKNKHKSSPIEIIEKYNKSKQDKIDHKQKPKAPSRLSRQQIDDYYTCPKKYYFSNVIKIPLPTNWHFMYGTAIHEAIGRYFQRKINGTKNTLDTLIEDYESCFSNEGFLTREHEEQRFKKGIETLTKFYQEDQKSDITPFSVEDAFEIQIGDTKIRGRYDLILKNGKDYEIYDYKTSNVKTQKDADRRIKESTQMAIYALAFRQSHNIIPKTSLVFIESGIKASKHLTEKNLDETIDIINDVSNGIKKEDYRAKPNLIQCSYCPYKDICDDSK